MVLARMAQAIAVQKKMKPIAAIRLPISDLSLKSEHTSVRRTRSLPKLIDDVKYFVAQST
jgi:hypothetical protein